MKTRKAVLYLYSGGVEKVLLNPDARDNCSEPYINFKNTLEQNGYDFHWEKRYTLAEYDWIIFLDVNTLGRLEWHRKYARRIKNLLLGRPMLNFFESACKEGLNDRMALILAEPPKTEDDLLQRQVYQYFRYVFTWNDELVDNRKFIKFYPPITRFYPPIETVDFSKRKLIVNITGNKLSQHPRELYSKRIESIRFFERFCPDHFDLYGAGWNQSKPKKFQNSGDKSYEYFPSYKGTIRNKWEVLPNYRFALCYENLFGERGYVTEKIFDALRCYTIPIYLGAPNIHEFVDSACFIDRRDFKSDEELLEYLSTVDEPHFREYLMHIGNYLTSERYQLFLSGNYAKAILKRLFNNNEEQ